MQATLGNSILISFFTLVFVTCTFKFLNWAWFRPKRLEKLLREQGIHGNPYRFLVGDLFEYITAMRTEQSKAIDVSDDIIPHILPYYHNTIEKHGKNSFIWLGPFPCINVSDPELIKEVLLKSSEFQKPFTLGASVIGGLLFLEGEKWAKHRRIINMAFRLDKLKTMTSAMFLSCSSMMEKWEALVSDFPYNQEVDVWPYLEDLSGDVISRTAFGGNYEQGRVVCQLQKEQVKLIPQLIQNIFVPGLRFLPTKANRKMKANSERVKALLRGMIEQRQQAMDMGENVGDDLLGTLMVPNRKEIEERGDSKKLGLSIKDIIEECKLFYFAGSETNASLMAWTMVLLSKHQEWQAQAREEVMQVFGDKEPTYDGLNRLKTVTMILLEALRLYPPVAMTVRAPSKTMKLGNMTLPYGVQLSILIGLSHHDRDIWGEDVKEFKPERFSEGFSSPKSSFMPFSSGPRICPGQNFAMMEAKMGLAMILQRFSFELSSSYLHSPFQIATLQPQHGVSLVLHKL